MDKNERNEQGLTFAEWLAQANAEVLAHCGLSLEDLPDSCTYDAWLDCVEPADHVEELLAEEGFPL